MMSWKTFALCIGMSIALTYCGGKKQGSTNAQAVNYDTAKAAQGEALYKQNCATCHGDSGHGDGPAGMALPVKPRNFTADTFKFGTDLASIIKTITEGAGKLGGSPQMASYKGVFSPEQIEQIAHYVLKLRSGG